MMNCSRGPAESERHSFTLATALPTPADRVSAHASTFAGINRELRPLGQMTYPPAKARLTPEAFPPGQVALRSWVLLFGLVPVDYDDITLVELEPGRGFHESSRLFSLSRWEHRRTIEPAGDGCVVRDEVSFEPRWSLAGPLLARVYRLAFQHRHRRLRGLFAR